jgi:hypothetical protein
LIDIGRRHRLGLSPQIRPNMAQDGCNKKAYRLERHCEFVNDSVNGACPQAF